jgi:hypothetical protein
MVDALLPSQEMLLASTMPILVSVNGQPSSTTAQNVQREDEYYFEMTQRPKSLSPKARQEYIRATVEPTMQVDEFRQVLHFTFVTLEYSLYVS